MMIVQPNIDVPFDVVPDNGHQAELPEVLLTIKVTWNYLTKSGKWKAVLSNGRKQKKVSGQLFDTSTSHLELTAFNEGLKHLKGPRLVTVHTNSNYVKRGVSDHISVWIKQNWKGSSGQLKCREGWESFLKLNKGHRFLFKRLP